jgi:cell wall-associated NlpC family hydrolase
MTQHTGNPRTRTARTAAVLGLSTALLTPVLGLATAAPAAAHTTSASSTQTSDVGARAVQEAAQHEGKPYEYGATGPGSFDCSGFVQYVYAQVGVAVPRTSGDQYAASSKVSQADRRLGDLIAMRNSDGRITHVGIYAGDDSWWVARRTGTTVTKQALYSSHYSVGRVG